MPFVEEHIFEDTQFDIPLTDAGAGFQELVVDISGVFNIRFCGKLFIFREAKFLVRSEPPPENAATEGLPHNERPIITSTPIPLTLDIRAPDGMPFTKDEITLADLLKYRDLRGESKGHWTYRLWGRSGKYPTAANSPIRAFPGTGHFKIVLQEHVPSKSPPPLVYAEIPAGGRERFTFDLYRVGTFVATAQPPRMMKLIDPNGVTVATSETGELRFPVPLQTIDLSRDEAAKPRLWALDLRDASPAPEAPTAVWASVIETARIRTEQVQKRINTLLGDGGSKVQFYGRDFGDYLHVLMKINDEVTAGTLDMFGLLDHALYGSSGEGGHRHIDLNREYHLGSVERRFTVEVQMVSATFNVSVGSLQVSRIDVSFGPSERLHQPSPFTPPTGPPIPAMKIAVEFSGEAAVRLGDFKVATITIGRIPIEAGIRLNADGTLSPEVWTASDPIDVDISVQAAVVAGLLNPLLLGAAVAAIESKEATYNDKLVEGITEFVTNVLKSAPRFFAVLLGDSFSFTSFRPEGDEFVLEYVAPVEPEPRPSRMYKAIIGRSVTELGPNAHMIKPRSLGNTWEAGSLIDKIDHIFIVMMENRSFDHVLGYLGRPPIVENSDGLTAEIVQAIEDVGRGNPNDPPFYQVREFRRIRDTAEDGSVKEIEENEVHLKTQLDEHVGHGLRDVREQISHTITTADGRAILSPQGFVSNFLKHQSSDSRVKPTDILGYYTNDPPIPPTGGPEKDLPFFDFLVNNYAWCERFFCSHPGPTLPNRMLWLTGDVQYDRTGEAILDNNKSANFFLSRAHNICDLLTRKGVSWRVYESEPSVAMLRMFARYSTDATNIVPYSRERLMDDVINNDVPSVVFIEPAMHHYPPSDDHPPADMYRGQLFLKDVYDAVTANQDVWRKSMLIVTYDEHGGFYDHVIPPVAEIRTAPHIREVGGHVLEPVGEGGSGSGGGGSGGGGGRFGIIPELAEAVLSGETELPGSVIVGPLGENRAPISEVFEGEGVLTPTPIEGRLSLTTHYGVRVPTFVISPWVAPGKGPDTVLDHCSIIKTILARFLGDQKPFVSDRVHSSHSFNGYLTLDEPRMNIASPDLETLDEEHMHRGADPIITRAVFRRQMRHGNVDYHDLTGMMARVIGPPRL